MVDVDVVWYQPFLGKKGEVIGRMLVCSTAVDAITYWRHHHPLHTLGKSDEDVLEVFMVEYADKFYKDSK